MMIGTVQHIILRPVNPVIGHHFSARIAEARFTGMGDIMLASA